MNDRRSLIRQIIHRLNDEDLNIIAGSNGGRPPCAIRISSRRIQLRAKYLKIHHRPECFELVAEIAQPFQPIINIEKSRLASASNHLRAHPSQWNQK